MKSFVTSTLTRRSVLSAGLLASIGPAMAWMPAPSAAATALPLSGRLLDTQGQPIAQATLRLGEHAWAQTDADGRFFVHSFSTASSQVHFDCSLADGSQVLTVQAQVQEHGACMRTLQAQLSA
jgi:protocatechuate 3,4-dioxygenase beta subunit